MTAPEQTYPARLDIDYPESLNRVTTAFRIIVIIPIAILANILSATVVSTVTVVQRLLEVRRQAGLPTA